MKRNNPDRCFNPAITSGALIALGTLAALGIGSAVVKASRRSKRAKFPVLVEQGTTHQNSKEISYKIYRFSSGRFYWSAKCEGKSAGRGYFASKEQAYQDLKHTYIW